jgi:hypothetical protein
MQALASAGLLHREMQANGAVREKWRAVATYGPSMLLDAVGVRVRPQTSLQSSSLHTAVMRAKLPFHR